MEEFKVILIELLKVLKNHNYGWYTIDEVVDMLEHNIPIKRP